MRRAKKPGALFSDPFKLWIASENRAPGFFAQADSVGG
jgi:hypothetical protein